MSPNVPLDEYVARLARKPMSAGVLFRDRVDRVLLVEPSYKPNWEIPGGSVEADESPWRAARREVAEELGWDRPVGRLLVLDHLRREDPRPDRLAFVFDGGVLDESALDSVVLAEDEIVSAAWHDLEQVRVRVRPALADRLTAAVDAARSGATALCEQGVVVS